jgi:hypothetical protein
MPCIIGVSAQSMKLWEVTGTPKMGKNGGNALSLVHNHAAISVRIRSCQPCQQNRNNPRGLFLFGILKDDCQSGISSLAKPHLQSQTSCLMNRFHLTEFEVAF